MRASQKIHNISNEKVKDKPKFGNHKKFRLYKR